MWDWGDFVGALAGALLGAGVGFWAVSWQHKAQRSDAVRDKGARLIFLGEQHKGDINGPENAYSEAPKYRRQQNRLEEMGAITRNLQVIASPNISSAADNYLNATQRLVQGTAEQEDQTGEFSRERDALMQVLKHGRGKTKPSRDEDRNE